MSPTIGFLLLVTCTAFFNVLPTKATDLKTYIIHLSSPEVQVLNVEEWYNSFLSKVAARSNEKPEIVHKYHHVITGFAAKMTADQAEMMERLGEVLSVRPEGMYQLHTTRTPNFLGLRQNSRLWKDSNHGKGIIIGLFDTGITPGHPSFDDHGVPPPPATWKGKCEVAGCNNKLIGIRNFMRGLSPIDEDGHGTHTSGIAAGNFVDNANVFGLANGTANGMAPLAHVAMYKVCTYKSCTGDVILAGMDAAIEDGVDVMSLSLAPNSSSFHSDSLAIGAFSAMQRGIFVSCSAGNSGPNNTSLFNEAPWILTVGASTIDRRFRTTVVLGNKKKFHGESLYQPKDCDQKLRPLVYGAWCKKESLDHIDAKGKVVLCDHGDKWNTVSNGTVVKDAGGVAMIMTKDIVYGESIIAEPHVILASNVGYKEGVEIKKYLNSTSSPVATIRCGGTVVGLKSNPQMTSFSSRGPNRASPGILKPDVTGPGMDILAAWHHSVDNKTGTKATFNVIEGTSMSCPHLAGISALLKSAHPEWSPAAIKSAIMTTANQVNRKGEPIVDERGLPADVFAMGSGHVNPPKAHEPGLVFDIQPEDYIPYLCGLGYTPKQIEIIVRKKANCSKTIPEAQLNYPSFSVTLKRGDHKTYSRTVTNVGLPYSRYSISDISVPEGVSMKVVVHNDEGVNYVGLPESGYSIKGISVPKGVSIKFVVQKVEDVMSFTELQQKRTYEVTFSRDAKDKEKGSYGQGHMTWVDETGKYSVRTPFSFKFE